MMNSDSPYTVQGLYTQLSRNILGIILFMSYYINTYVGRRRRANISYNIFVFARMLNLIGLA